MKIFANKDIKTFFTALSVIMTIFLLLSQLVTRVLFKNSTLVLLLLFLLMICSVFTICFWYFGRQNKIMETAVSQINAYLAGDTDARIDCDYEGELYRLFHSVNTLAAVLNAHAENELQSKEFLKKTISDISHQLKTPLAALNIYNGLLQDESEELPAIREFVTRSEQELDRMETLVQNLLKITKLDAGSIVLEKVPQNVADMMKDIELQFAYRAKQEQKEMILSGADDILLPCDRDWLMEAIGNIVKNALDHTKQGDCIHLEWKQFMSMVQIIVKDNGSGIHPEDLHHIFKRFYRSRFSTDVQGIGLGLPLAKTIIEAHDGTIEVDSQLGVGTTFVINFLIPTKL
ncbi:MAG: HAMP domain-containing histidine kinase [Lachnospiraceae bacterium]|nr:HAMP domain-containing histidine kinase [Lachnospiraceae bacterium]